MINSKDIFNIVVDLAKMQDAAIRSHNTHLIKELNKISNKGNTFNLSKNKDNE